MDYSFSADTTTSYTIESSSNWSIYYYDSNRVRCSKSGNILYISLGEDKSETYDKEIILRNREGCEAIVKYSIESGLVSESGVTFTFDSGRTVITSAITQSAATEDIIINVCVFAYDNDNNAIEWKVKSSSFVADITDLKGGTNECKSVELKATETTKKPKAQNYTIKLQEQETYKELIIKVNITRPKEEISDGYYIEISPESGTYGGSIADGFQVTVTPTYIYNGTTYFIGDWDMMKNQNGFKGVSAKTTVNDVTIEPSSTGYDSIIYNIDINEGTTQFEVCSTAVTYDGTAESSTITCNTISLSAITEESFCSFKTDVTEIIVGSEETAVTYSFLSQKNDERAELDYDYTEKPDWVTFNLDEDGETITYTFSANESYDERSGTTIFKSPCEGKENITINFKQKFNDTIFTLPFDYLFIRYFWNKTNGENLDTVTVISSLLDKDNKPITNISGYSYINDSLGYDHSSKVVDDNENILLEFGGDNQGYGNECVYIDFQNLCSITNLKKMLDDGVVKIHIDLYGNWYTSRLNGNLDISLIGYSDCTIKGPIDYNFINDGGYETYNITKHAKVCAQGKNNSSAYTTNYTHIGYVEYDITKQSAILTLNSECVDPVYVLERTEVASSITITYDAQTLPLKFNSTKDGVFFNNLTASENKEWITLSEIEGVENPLTINYTVEENDGEEDRLCGIVITQGESNKTLTYKIIQESKCGCAEPVVVNADVVITCGEMHDNNNGSYVFNVTATATLDKTITCGNATVVVYYGIGSIDNAGFSTITIEDGNNVGFSDIEYTCGLINEYDYNKPMNCISSVRTGHEMYFSDSNSDCYTKGLITVTVEEDALCQPCTCEVTSISVTPNSYKFTYDGEEKIFTLKVETDTCDSCTKGYKLYDPKGNLVTTGSGENTVTITYATAIKGEYILESVDSTSSVTLTIDKFEAYCLMDIAERESENGPIIGTVSSSITLTYPSYTANVEKYLRLRSRYYTSDEEYQEISFSVVSDSPEWLIVSGNGTSFSWTVQHNDTYDERNGTITVTQNEGNCSKQVLIKIKQSGKDTTWTLSPSGTTIEPEDIEAYVDVKSLRNEQPYSAIMFSERCDWITGYYLQSSSNGIYTYQFVTTPNTGTTERTCTITVQQEGGITNKKFDITQKAVPEEEVEEKAIVTQILILNNCPGSVDIEYTDTHGNKTYTVLEAYKVDKYNVPISGQSSFQVSVPYGNYENNNSNFIYVEFLDSNGVVIKATPTGSYMEEGNSYKFLPGTDWNSGGGTLCTDENFAKYQSCGKIIFLLN